MPVQIHAVRPDVQRLYGLLQQYRPVVALFGPLLPCRRRLSVFTQKYAYSRLEAKADERGLHRVGVHVAHVLLVLRGVPDFRPVARPEHQRLLLQRGVGQQMLRQQDAA